MHPPIENPTDCEIRAVIGFLSASVKAAHKHTKQENTSNDLHIKDKK